MFVFYLGRAMREQMDYFNQLYSSAQHKFDPFITSDIRQEMDSTSTNESSGKSSGTQSNESTANSTSDTTADNSSMTFNSEFPQTRIDDFRKYATTASQTDSTGNTHTATQQDSTATASSTSNTDFRTRPIKAIACRIRSVPVVRSHSFCRIGVTPCSIST